MNDLNSQGIKYNKNKKKYNRLVSKRKLKKISKNRLSQRLEEKDANFFKLEGFVGNDKEREGFDDGIVRMQAEFDETLSLYQSKYREYLNEVKNQINSPTSSSERLIKIVDNDGNDLGKGYMINKHGIARMFESDDWNAIKGNDAVNKRVSRKCPEMETMTEDEINNYTKGPNMIAGEFCASGGRNIKYDNLYAWVDVKGMKHVYDNFNQRHGTCTSGFNLVSQDQWNLMNDGTGWNPSKKCEIIDHNKGLTNELTALNDKMIRIVGDMKRASTMANKNTEQVESNMKLNHSEYQKIVENLKRERSKLTNLERSLHSLDSEFNKHYGKVKSIKVAHFIWALAGLSFVFLILKYMRN
tara:strand:+ start:4171 stop:5238 length:1068 start_codon:yes stop_codon:yes gene_type:complete